MGYEKTDFSLNILSCNYRYQIGIKVTVASINASYEGVNMGKSIMGTFKQHEGTLTSSFVFQKT